MVAKHIEERAKKLLNLAFQESKDYQMRVEETNNPRFARVTLLNKAGLPFPLYYFLVDIDDEVVVFGDPHLTPARMVELADVGAAVKVGEQ